MTLTVMPGPTARRPVAVPRAPNRVAEKLTGRSYLSHSQISLMRSCPRKFAFQYVENAPRDFVASTLLLGGAIHAALELYFRARLEGLAVSTEAMPSAYHDSWKRQQSADKVPVRFNKAETHETVDATAHRMLTAFLTSPLADPKGVIVGIEEELRIVLDPDLPDLLAKVDLVTQTDGSLHVIDFKTSRSRWNEQKASESGDQLVLYGQTLSGMASSLGLPVKLHFAILTKHKTPQVQLLPVAADEQRVASLRDGIAQV